MRGGDGGEIGKGFNADGCARAMGFDGASEVAELAWVGGGYVEDHGRYGATI